MNIEEIVSKLKKCAEFSEVYQKTTFECCLTDKSGNQQTVEVSVLDAGPKGIPQNRYQCVVKSEDGKTDIGNTSPSIDMALRNIHWDQLGN